MSGKKYFKFIDNKMIMIAIFLGAAIIGFTTGNVVAQEVKIGDTSGTPFISFEDAMTSGMYEIRLNDGTGEFQIWDMTNSRNALIIGDNGNVGVGDAGSTIQDFVIGCSEGLCNIQTRASNGTAQNTVRSLGGEGNALFKLQDDSTSAGTVRFEISTQDNGNICLGDPNNEPCMLIFDTKGSGTGQVKQADGTCIANC